jgi:hypothetical protein
MRSTMISRVTGTIWMSCCLAFPGWLELISSGWFIRVISGPQAASPVARRLRFQELRKVVPEEGIEPS